MVKTNKHSRYCKRRNQWIMLILAIILISQLMSFSAFAADTNVESMNVRVMPEYDDPRVLVILEPTLSDDTTIPATIKFLISKKQKPIEIGMACEVSSGGGHQCKSYQTTDAGDFNELSFDTQASRNLFLEYYWNPFQSAKDKKREFVYEFKSPLDIKQLDFQIQKPKNAKNFKIEPSSNIISKDQEGLDIYAYSYSNFKANKVIKFKVSYDTGGLSKSKEGDNKESSSIPTNFSGIQWLLILLVPITALGIYLYSKKAKNAPVPKSRKKASGNKNYKSFNNKETNFCTICGNNIKNDKNFCSKCGEKI